MADQVPAHHDNAVQQATVWIGPGYAAYLGPSLDLDPHSTPVACLAVSLHGTLVLSASECGTVTASSAFSLARYEHGIDCAEGGTLFLFVDPVSSSTDLLMEQMQRTAGPFGFEHRAAAELIAACREPIIDIGRILELAGVSTQTIIDTRIANIVRTIRSDPSVFTRADAVAQQLELSRAHFLHLFGDHTATSFRRYRQWAMMMRAAEVLDKGHDLTRCAMEAGFASPSHFSKTFHSLFGLSATALLLRAEVQLKFATVPALAG